MMGMWIAWDADDYEYMGSSKPTPTTCSPPRAAKAIVLEHRRILIERKVREEMLGEDK